MAPVIPVSPWVLAHVCDLALHPPCALEWRPVETIPTVQLFVQHALAVFRSPRIRHLMFSLDSDACVVGMSVLCENGEGVACSGWARMGAACIDVKEKVDWTCVWDWGAWQTKDWA